jgi:hypothetical protein
MPMSTRDFAEFTLSDLNTLVFCHFIRAEYKARMQQNQFFAAQN